MSVLIGMDTKVLVQGLEKPDVSTPTRPLPTKRPWSKTIHQNHAGRTKVFEGEIAVRRTQ